jgi:hypothetical protein
LAILKYFYITTQFVSGKLSRKLHQVARPLGSEGDIGIGDLEILNGPVDLLTRRRACF